MNIYLRKLVKGHLLVKTACHTLGTYGFFLSFSSQCPNRGAVSRAAPRRATPAVARHFSLPGANARAYLERGGAVIRRAGFCRYFDAGDRRTERDHSWCDLSPFH